MCYSAILHVELHCSSIVKKYIYYFIPLTLLLSTLCLPRLSLSDFSLSLCSLLEISPSPFALHQATISHHRPATPSPGRVSMFCSNVALMFCSDGFAPMWVWFMGFSVEIGPAWVIGHGSLKSGVGCGLWVLNRCGSWWISGSWISCIGWVLNRCRSWWVVVDLGLRIVVDRRIWSSRFFGFFFFFGCCYDWCYVYPNYKTVGLGSYLGSQSICFVGFWISYCEWSYARQAQICFYFLTPFTLPHWITLLFSLSIHSIFLVLFPEFPHLLFIAQY